MSFWQMSDGGNATQDAQGSFDGGGGDIKPIPANTGCIAVVEEIKWDEFEGDRFISAKWRVSQPQQYANRVIFHKLKVYGTGRDRNPSATADKAKRMLAAMDTNAGGRLSRLQSEPTDQDLMSALAGRMMAIKVQVWKMKIEGDDREGNWVSAVAPAKQQAAAPAPQPAPAPSTEADDFSDIPF